MLYKLVHTYTLTEMGYEHLQAPRLAHVFSFRLNYKWVKAETAQHPLGCFCWEATPHADVNSSRSA